MPTVLVTGANRGLGLEFVRQYSQDDWQVHACCRDPRAAEELTELAQATDGRVRIHPLDVTDAEQISALAEALGDGSIDVLINNAGAFLERAGFGEVDYENWRQVFEINVLAPMRVAEALIEHLNRSELKILANVSSKMGSIADNTSGGCYVYRSSKAALNMVTVSQAHDLRSRGVVAVVLHPGWVATRMGGAGAPLEAPASVQGMRAVLAGLGSGDSGKFFNYSGEEIPW